MKLLAPGPTPPLLPAPRRIALQLRRSAEIIRLATEVIKPKLVVSLVSGGDDSLTNFYVAQMLGIHIDYIVHVDTGTGIRQTHEFVQQWALTTGVPMIAMSAGKAYEKYVDRKGFFGKGEHAHNISYHVLKATFIRKAVSSIRKHRRNFPVMMLTGLRLDESDRRKYNFADQTIKKDGKNNNYFVNHIEDWTGADCQEFLASVKAPRNPVTKLLHRSGECMCGSMQTPEDRRMASFFFPEWGQWLDNLEARAIEKHGWGWDESMPESIQQERAGQMRMFDDDFMLCRNCILNARRQEAA